MGVVKTLLRFFSYLYHGILALFLAGISGLALVSGGALQLGMLPWSGSTLALVLFLSSLFGLISLLLAMRGKLRPLFFVWALAVAGFMVKGYIFSGYRFTPGAAAKPIYLMLGGLLALLGAWFQIWRTVGREKRY